jgi:hypothetical protein
MKVLTLDPKRTHEHNPGCPMRLVPTPDKHAWMCLDCGMRIMMTSVEVMPIPERVPDFERDPRT